MMPKPIYSHDLTDAGSYGFVGLSHKEVPVSVPRFFLDDSLLMSPFGHSLPTVLADLLDIAAFVMWADRHDLRIRTRKAGRFNRYRGWARGFSLTLGVRNPALWMRAEIKERLEGLLMWLTEDEWHLTFRQQQVARRPSDMQATLFPSPPTNALVALFSGGLDSLAGVVRLLQAHPDQNFVLVSAVHHRLQGVIQAQVEGLQQHYGKQRIQQAFLPFHLVRQPETPYSPRKQEEPTQRTRGFLFLTFGAAAAVACGATRILTCENGIGALNLPFNWRQLGTQHTRAMHPRTLIEMTQLLALLGLDNLHFEAPHLFQTKGELCTHLRLSGLGELVKLTVSCDGFPQRVPSPSPDTQIHCGWCTSCLLRRQAIFASQLVVEDSPVHYQRDVCSPLSSNQTSYLEPLKMMVDQVTTIKQALALANPEQMLLQEFPELVLASHAIIEAPAAFGVVKTGDALEGLYDLLRRYTEEWDVFPYELSPA